MKWTVLLDVVLAFLVLWGVVFQIILPMIYRTPYFPIFRSRQSKAERKLAEAVEERSVATILQEAEAIRPMSVEPPPTSATSVKNTRRKRKD